jgi:hypothetical protein
VPVAELARRTGLKFSTNVTQGDVLRNSEAGDLERGGVKPVTDVEKFLAEVEFV